MILDSQQIEVKLFYEEKISSGGVTRIIVYTDEDGKKKKEEQEKHLADKKASGEAISPEDQLSIKTLTTQWKVITWGDQTLITGKCEKYNPAGIQDLDYIKYRDMRLKKSLVGWDIKNDTGQDIPCVEQYIDALPSHVVAALLDKYDQLVLGNDEEETKN